MAHPIDEFVGIAIRLHRRERGITQQELAVRIKISHQQIQRYEAARNRVPASMLFEIALALDVPIDAIYYETAKQAAPIAPSAAKVAELIKLYNSIPEHIKPRLLALAKSLITA